MHIENSTDCHTASSIFSSGNLKKKKTCLGIIFTKITIVGKKWICLKFYVGE